MYTMILNIMITIFFIKNDNGKEKCKLHLEKQKFTIR
jgi:hypothetical protein